MNDRIRELFEENVFPSFALGETLRRNNKGEYISANLEDHWQTFQEGFELAVEECRNVLADEYRKSPADTIGCFIRADEVIAKHFGVKE